MSLGISSINSISSSWNWIPAKSENAGGVEEKAATKKTAFFGGCGGLPEFEIDPSQDCNLYPPDMILNDLKIKYKSGTQELPGERENIQRIMSSMDYRFTEGIGSVIVYEHEKCLSESGKMLMGRYVLNWKGAKIELCRQRDGEGGAFQDIYSLKGTIHHEVGHHVEYKIGEKFSEFNNICLMSSPEDDCREDFAYDFTKYTLIGPFFKYYADIFGDKYTKFDRYNWFKENIFCGKEYEENQIPSFQYDMALKLYYSYDYDRALVEYEKLIQNFPDSEYASLARIGIGECYAGLRQCDKAFEILEETKLEHPEVAARAQFAIARTYQSCLKEYDSAILEYQELIDEFPDSKYVPDSLFSMGLIYSLYLKDPEKAIERFQKMIDNYPDHRLRPIAMFEMAICYIELDSCQSAIEILQRYIYEYPDHDWVTDAQEMISRCTD